MTTVTLDGWTDGWMMDGQMDGQTDGWMDGWIVGQMEGWNRMTPADCRINYRLTPQKNPAYFALYLQPPGKKSPFQLPTVGPSTFWTWP